MLAFRPVALLALTLIISAPTLARGDWTQLQGDPQRSGNAAEAQLPDDLGLLRAIPLSDGIYAAPIVESNIAYVIDGSGLVVAIDTSTGTIRWRFQTEGGAGNCNNVSSPALIGEYLHVATAVGYHYVLNKNTGDLVHRNDLQEPVFSALAVSGERVYIATLGARVFAMSAAGETAWSWDFVKEIVGFDGNRWSGAEWAAFRKDRVTWKDHFVCSRDICVIKGRTIVMPAGGRTVFLEDTGSAPRLRQVGEIPTYAGSEFPATFGQSADAAGNVYVQWHRRDNAGRVEKMTLGKDDKISATHVRGTQTSIRLPGLLSFASVAIRGDDVYRVRPEYGRGLCRHNSKNEPQVLSPFGSVSPPVVTAKHVAYACLDGKVRVVALDGENVQTLATGFDAPLTAPLAIADGRVLAAGEDGYLYIFGAGGEAPAPTKRLDLHKIRSPLTGPLSTPEFDWYTNYGDFAGTNANSQGLRPPLRMRWARRLEGTVKHLPVCGGGRLYTHTAEGQIIAVEQDTGRLLWRRYWPDVYLSFTSPLYIDGKLLVPQAGIKRSLMRCLDASTGKLLWEAPFTGSPSWSRQFPPVAHKGVAIYASGSGVYAPQGSEKPFTFGGDPVDADGREVMSWIYSNDNPYYPKDNFPRLWAWDWRRERSSGRRTSPSSAAAAMIADSA